MDHQKPSITGGAPPKYQPPSKPLPGIHYPVNPSQGFTPAPMQHHDSLKSPGYVGLEVNQLPHPPPYNPAYSQPYMIQEVPNMMPHHAVAQDNLCYHSPPPPYTQQLINQPPMPQVVVKGSQENSCMTFSRRKILVGVFFTLLAVKLVLVGILRS